MLSIKEVNMMDYPDFRDNFGTVIEHTPMVAAGVWNSRPFQNRAALCTAFTQCVQTLHKDAKTGILRCHPDLAGKLSEEDRLSEESTKEQKSAGLLSLPAEEKASLTELNEQYKTKFQFPFILCVRENKKEAIFREIRKRVNNSVDEEIETGIEEVCKIAIYRITDLVEEHSSL